MEDWMKEIDLSCVDAANAPREMLWVRLSLEREMARGEMSTPVMLRRCNGEEGLLRCE